jgi:hypothetical protein
VTRSTSPARSLPLIAAGLLCAAAAAADPARIELETQGWYADNGLDAALLWGPELVVTARPELALRARWWQGSFNPGGDIEDVREWRVAAGWRKGIGELGAGYAGVASHTQLQPGWAWAYPEEEAERNADIHGPLVYARAGARWGGGPLGWRAGAAWLARDFGDFDDLGRDGSFVEVEAALTWERTRWQAGAGYRHRAFRDLPPRAVQDDYVSRDTLDGAFATLSFRW